MSDEPTVKVEISARLLRKVRDLADKAGGENLTDRQVLEGTIDAYFEAMKEYADTLDAIAATKVKH